MRALAQRKRCTLLLKPFLHLLRVHAAILNTFVVFIKAWYVRFRSGMYCTVLHRMGVTLINVGVLYMLDLAIVIWAYRWGVETAPLGPCSWTQKTPPLVRRTGFGGLSPQAPTRGRKHQ